MKIEFVKLVPEKVDGKEYLMYDSTMKRVDTVCISDFDENGWYIVFATGEEISFDEHDSFLWCNPEGL